MADSSGNAGARGGDGALPEKDAGTSGSGDEPKDEDPEEQQEPGWHPNPYGFDRKQWP
jgi:hypothetical protein